MAVGVRRWSGADIGLAVSGIAGPTGGTVEKPVGLVHWAATSEAGTIAEHFICHRRERESIRLWSADRALNAARRAIVSLVKSQ
jgi:nicotinamide-nucleotide amidase